MIKTTTEANTTTIEIDADTADKIWAMAWGVATDPEASESTKETARNLANAIDKRPEWQI